MNTTPDDPTETTQRETSLRDDVREIIAELDADGGGFRTREASNLLFLKITKANVYDRKGKILPKPAQAMRRGCASLIKDYEPERKAVKAAEFQMNLSEVVGADEHQWLHQVAALDESEDAVRKTMLRLTLPEILRVIALKRRKAAEAWATAERLQDIVDRNPQWTECPTLTVADILDLRE